MGRRDPVALSPPGRLYFWGERVLYLGPGLPAGVHSHHAVQVCIPLSGSVRLRAGPSERWRSYTGAWIASDASHESDLPVPLIATFWLAPETAEARRLAPPDAGAAIRSLPRSQLAAVVPRLREGWREGYGSRRAAALLQDVVQAVGVRDRPASAIDGRVARALEIQAAAPERRVSLAVTAARVALSPWWLAHLFARELGIPPRRHLLWLRLRDAVEELARGASITRAAHVAGFADGAHLCRTFRRMLGFPPSSAVRVSKFVQDGAAP